MPTAEIDGLRVNYADTGSGLPMVCIPGLVGSKEWFREQSTGLSDRYRVISYDLRRTGGRAKPDIDVLAGDLSGLLKALRLNGAVVVGHSLGGLIGLRLAASHPERCLALVVVSCAPSFSAFSEEDLLSELAPGEIRFDSLFGRLRERLLGAKAAQNDESDPLGYLAAHNAGLDRATLRSRLKLMRTCDLTPCLEDIMVPTLIAADSTDAAQILAGAQLMYERIPDSGLEVMEGAGRFWFHTRHDVFNCLIHDYVSLKVTQL